MSAELNGSQLANAAEPVAEGLDRGPRPRSRSRLSQPNEFRTPALPAPSLERASSWPQTARGRTDILTALDVLESGVAEKERNRRRLGMNLLLDWLERFEGTSWQQRWLASGADVAAGTWTERVDVIGLRPGAQGRAQLTGAAGRLIVLGAIRPSYQWLYRLISSTVFERFRSVHDPQGFAALDVLCDATARFTATDLQFAYCQLTRILMHNGGRLVDITVEDCVEAYRAQTGYSARQHSYWYVLLLRAGILPEGSPPTVWAANRRGQLTVEELVDGYQVANGPVRDLLVDYLHERQAAMDYVSLRQLSTKLVLLFWRDLELHEPGIDSLHLSDQMIRDWKQRLTEVRYGSNRLGRHREDPHAVFMAVRAFYADLSHWALEDPARWAHWVAPNPIRSQDTRGMMKQRTRSQARMHQRTRELAPMLPLLVEAAETGRRHASRMLHAAAVAAPGEWFEVDGVRLRRSVLATDPANGGTGRPGVIYADDPGGGSRRNLTLAEDTAFWTWAIVEVLRHTGVRIEELLELTHRGFVAYTLPSTGEVVPLLQIVPSKTDRERLLVVSPELAEVLTAVIARGRGDNEYLPLVSRYDGTERLHSPPLPFLFQRHWGLSPHCLT
ncbi:MAG: hypothetical protein WCG47_17765, partial [Dermatophilaceae bacterium]